MEVTNPIRQIGRAFCGGVIIGVGLMYASLLVDYTGLYQFIETALADPGVIRPDGTGTTQGTATTCATTATFTCLDEVITEPTAPDTTSDYVTWTRDQLDYFLMGTVSGVSSVSDVNIRTYHQEGSANMQLEVSLWNAAETTQYGTTQLLTTRTSSVWDTASFTGLGLTQAQLDGLRVRLQCLRASGGAATNCRAFAMYADITYTPTVDVTVSTTGTQQNVDIGSTNSHIGGAFSIKENTSSRSITSMSIFENGTVDALSNISNVKLFYDLDNTGADSYNCSDQTYNGTEPQFGATDTDGFSAANGTSTFSGSVTISTTQSMCVYVVLDVGSGAAPGETLELQITNPSTNVVGGGSPNISPATSVALSGTTNLLKQDLRQTRYHWRSDDGDEGDSASGATSATGGSENTSFSSFPRGDIQRLRLGVSNEGNKTSASTAYRIEYATKVTTCANATGWTDVGAAADDFDMGGSGSGLTEGVDTTNIASATRGALTDDNAGFVGTGGQRETSSQTGAFTLTSTEFSELEFAVIATASSTEGATYCFRVTNAGTPIDHYDVYPEAIIAADLTVSATGSQATNINIPTTGAANGGGFVITDSSAGAHTMSSVTITASGTVDYQNNIDNIKLWYDLDNAAPYDCTGENFGGDETQFGATDTDGFSAAGGAVFTGSVSVSPTQGVCLYVEYDVLAGASDGETIEIRLTDPPTDIVIDSGTVAPAALVDIDGVSTLVKASLTQAHYHWRTNLGTESASLSATGGSEDTLFSNAALLTTYRLRLGVQNTGGTAATAANYSLEWAQRISTCSAATGWTRVDAAGDAFSTSTSQLTDGNDTTDIAVADGGVSNDGLTFQTPNGGQKELTDETGSISIDANAVLELEYAITATANAIQGATYCFRITNAGTPISSYAVYPELTVKQANDFTVTRGVTTIAGGVTTASLTEGVDYDLQINDAARAFVRITNVAMTGAGPASIGNHNAADVTAYISATPAITSGVTFARSGTTGDTRIAWEVIEYVGSAGGENEIIVRQTGVATYGTGNLTVTTGTITGILDDTDVLPWITGQGNPDTGRFDYNTGLSTSAWNAGTDTATFTRGETGTDAVNVSYAVLEFTGANWKIQRAEHTYATAGGLESQSITAVNSIARTFLHVQKRVGSGLDTHADFGHEVYLSGIGAIQFRIDGVASTPGGHTSVAWVVENTQTSGETMKVWRSNGTIGSSGTAPVITNPSIGTTLLDITAASLLVNARANSSNRTFHEPIIGARLTASTTAYELWVGDPSDSITYQAEVVEWPTANAFLTQNYYRWYADNDTLTPSDPWPTGVTDIAENQEITTSFGPVGSAASIRLRMTIAVSAATLPAGIDSFQLEYAERTGANCTSIGESEWLEVGTTSSTTAAWRGTAGTPADGATLSSLLISVADVLGTYEDENNSAVVPNAVLVGQDLEYDWNIENHAAAEKSAYCFRMTYADGIPLNSYSFYPVALTAGYGPQLWDWRWFDDEQNLTPTTTLAATNTAPIDIANGNALKLRAVVSELSGAQGTDVKFKLQYSEYPDFSAAVYDVVESGSCLATSTWCYADGAGVDNAVIDAAVLATADDCSGGIGSGCGTHNESISTTTATYDQPAFASTEYEFTIQNAAARANAVYYFRLFHLENATSVPASTTYPSVVVEGAQLTFTVDGLTAGATSEGVTADITTTPTTIPFGSVPFHTEYEGIYRLQVDTTATAGYQMYLYARQPLMNQTGSIIPDVLGTNASPVGWSTGCSAERAACFGYHTGDDVLSDGSTRFSPNDSYAAVSTTTPDEIMSASSPVEDVVDIVFKLEVREGQPPGDYETQVVYLTVPTF